MLAAAIQAGCDYLVTGDRTHFGALFGISVQGVKVMSPALLAESQQSHLIRVLDLAFDLLSLGNGFSVSAEMVRNICHIEMKF